MFKHSSAARLACAALAGLLIAAALFHSGCSDPSPDDQRATPNSDTSTAEIDQTVSQQAQTIEPMDSTQDVNAPDTTAGAKVGEVGAAQAGQTEPEGRGAAAATMSESSPQAEPQGLRFTLPEAAAPVNLYAGPGVDWAIRRIIQPRETLVILGRAPQVWYGGLGAIWLKAQLPDGAVGWLRANDLALDPLQLDDLRELHPQSMEELVVVRSGAHLYGQYDPASPRCQIESSAEARVGGRSADGQWFLVDFDRTVCTYSDDRWVGGGWASAAQIEPASILAEVPIVLRKGRWLISPDPQIQPIDELDQNRVKPWWELATEGQKVDTLPSPTGEHVLTYEDFDPDQPDSGTLAIIDRDDHRTEIGKLYLYSQGSEIPLLENHVRWSPDGRAIVVNDGGARNIDRDALDFWLYLVEEDRTVDLRGEASPVYVDYYDARFDRDGQSIYALKTERAPTRRTLIRLTLAGGDWPNFKPVPLERYRRYLGPAPDDLIITVAAGSSWRTETGLFWSSLGEPLGERHGNRFHVLPDGERFAYYVEGEFVIEHFTTADQIRLKLPESLFAYTILQWWPDGTHFAIVADLPSRDSHSWNLEQLRIYNLDGDLVGAYRTSGCTMVEQLPEQHWLLVATQGVPCAYP